jgi:non-heme chloroperoxidase
MKSFDQTKLNYKHYRGETTLIFVHGWPHNLTVWKNEVKYFRKKGYGTLALDLRGHGESEKPKKLASYSMNNFAKDINSIIRYEKIKNPVLIGHSFGGMILLKFMSLFPKKAKALVLIDTSYRNPLKDIKIIKQIKFGPLNKLLFKHIFTHEKLRKKHFKEADFSKIKGHTDFFYFVKGVKITPALSILACLKDMLKFDEFRILNKIKVPTLLIEGEKDYKTPINVARMMNRKIKGSKLVIIKGSSHDTNLFNPKRVSREIDTFLNEA